MTERTRALWRRHAALLAAVLFHIGLLLLLPSMISPPPPPSDPVDVMMSPPVPPPKRLRTPPAVQPAKTNASAERPYLKPAPRLPHISQPPLRLALPAPLTPRPPMSLPAASTGPTATGGPAGGSGGTGGGAGNGAGGEGSQEGNDYLIRLKAYIDSRKGRARHVEPNDADLVLVLDQDGVLHDIRVVASSGDPSVDDEIVNQLRQMSPFPKPPPVLFGGSRQLLPVADKWIFPRP